MFQDTASGNVTFHLEKINKNLKKKNLAKFYDNLYFSLVDHADL